MSRDAAFIQNTMWANMAKVRQGVCKKRSNCNTFVKQMRPSAVIYKWREKLIKPATSLCTNLKSEITSHGT